MSSPLTQRERQVAIAAGVIGCIANGAASLFWRLLAAIPATTLLAYRVIVSLVTLLLMMQVMGSLRGVLRQLSRKAIAIHAVAAILVAANWGAFIWAALYGHVIESGLGYLIAPFVAIGVGVVAYRDPMSRLRWLALLLIAGGVTFLGMRSGELSHWVYLVIGIGWGGYACMKKLTALDGFTGLLLETFVLTIVLVILLPVTPVSLGLPAQASPATLALLASSGLISVLPLWLFSRAANRLPLSTMGLLQFVQPSTQLVVALVFYRQPISLNTVVCFFVIWLALLVVVVEVAVVTRRTRSAFARPLPPA